MKKLLFFDIDGTLLSDTTHQVPQSAKEALKQAQVNGHLIFINTGRPYASISLEIKDLDYDGILCGCGTYIEYHQQILFHQEISPEIIKLVITSLRKYKVAALLEGKKAVYYDPNNQHPHVAQIKNNYTSIGMDTQHTWDDVDIHFDKFTIWHDEHSDFPALKKEMDPYFDYIERAHDFGEFVPHGFTKATGIQFLMNHLQVDHEHTYCFGDSTNDLSMLEYCQHSVAMKNSDPRIFNHVEYITTDVDDDGIANALKHYQLI